MDSVKRTKIRMMDISSIMLSLLIISINLREPFFHTREILYVLTMVSSFTLLDLRKIKYAIVLIGIWAVSVLYNLIIPGSNIDFGHGGFETIIISAYLLLMCFKQKRYAKVIINSYQFVSIIVAMIVISLWFICFNSDSAYERMRAFFIELKETTGLSLISIDKRMILGTRFLTVWYRTSPCMACTMGYCLSQRLDGEKRNILLIIILFLGLIFTGTRSNIISALLLVGFYIGIKIYKNGFRFTPLFLFSVIMIVALVFVIRFINDSNSQSSKIKVLDTLTYLDIYKSDPIRTVFFGWGPGSTFFSRGRQEYVNITENSLLETIRRFGFISTCIIIFGIWFSPFRHSRVKSGIVKIYYCCIFGSYMLSALTNPYLLDSVGFCALLYFSTIFSYGIGSQEKSILLKTLNVK